MKPIYLDHAAATPMDEDVRVAMEPYLTDKFYNPSASYQAAREVRQDIGRFREMAASLIGAKPGEIVFTAGATEANNLAVRGLMDQYPEGEILISSLEHESVEAPAEIYGATTIKSLPSGILDLSSISISDKTVLVSVAYVNNEIGTIQPLREVAAIIEDVRRRRLAAGNRLPLYLHTDAAQAASFLDLHVSRLGVDMMSLNGGKIYGPKQSGMLYVKAGIRLKPVISGGGQEYGLRSGTENTAAIAGFVTALHKAAVMRSHEARRLTELRLQFEHILSKKIPGSRINGGRHRAPHIVSLTLPGTDNERLMMELDEKGVICAVGSACSAGKEEPSRVLAAIGLDDNEARATLRFSLGRGTTAEDIGKTAEILAGLTGYNR